MVTMAVMCTRFKAADRETTYLLPPSVQDWLWAKTWRDLFRVSKLDLHELKMPYAEVVLEAFNPEMLLATLFLRLRDGVYCKPKVGTSDG